jgi:hypothetical protein
LSIIHSSPAPNSILPPLITPQSIDHPLEITRVSLHTPMSASSPRNFPGPAQTPFTQPPLARRQLLHPDAPHGSPVARQIADQDAICAHPCSCCQRVFCLIQPFYVSQQRQQ